MNKEQIEEMVKVMPEKIKDPLDNSRYIIFGKSLRREIARIYYNAGYRKVSKNYIGTDEILRSIDYRPTEEVRKETAREILSRINEYSLDYNYDLKKEFEKLCKDYGVEVEE